MELHQRHLIPEKNQPKCIRKWTRRHWKSIDAQFHILSWIYQTQTSAAAACSKTWTHNGWPNWQNWNFCFCALVWTCTWCQPVWYHNGKKRMWLTSHPMSSNFCFQNRAGRHTIQAWAHGAAPESDPLPVVSGTLGFSCALVNKASSTLLVQLQHATSFKWPTVSCVWNCPLNPHWTLDITGSPLYAGSVSKGIHAS